MDRALRDKWVKALRSGRYEQGTNFLRHRTDAPNKYAYCCLGVLGNCINRHAWKTDRPSDLYFGWGDADDISCLPPTILSDEIQERLSRLNDLTPSGFPEIADWIEENIPVEETSG